MDTCNELSEYLAAYADGELEGDLRERVRAHLEACETCRAECAALAKIVALYRDAPPPEMAEADWSRVSSALEATMAETPVSIETLRAGASGRRRWLQWVWPAAALAAAAVLVAVVINWDVLVGTGPTGPTNGVPIVAKGGPETPAVAVASIEGLVVNPQYLSVVRLPENPDDLLTVDFYGPE